MKTINSEIEVGPVALRPAKKETRVAMANPKNHRHAAKPILPEIQVTRKTRSRDGDIIYLDFRMEPGFEFHNWRLLGVRPNAGRIENFPNMWLRSPDSGYKFSRGGAVEVAEPISEQFKIAVFNAANDCAWTKTRKRRPPEIVLAERAALERRIQDSFAVKNVVIESSERITFDLAFRNQPVVEVAGIFDAISNGLYPRIDMPWDELKIAPYRRRDNFLQALIQRLSGFMDFSELHRLRWQHRNTLQGPVSTRSRRITQRGNASGLTLVLPLRASTKKPFIEAEVGPPTSGMPVIAAE
jgi:hypothetical protein